MSTLDNVFVGPNSWGYLEPPNAQPLVPAQPNVCPGCGKCRDCGQPYTYPYQPLYQYPFQQPYYKYSPQNICGTDSQEGVQGVANNGGTVVALNYTFVQGR